MSAELSSRSKEEILFNDLTLTGKAFESDLRAALLRVLESGWFILGPEVEAFEEEVARAFDSPFAVAVASGTDAITLALQALGVGRGDEVVTSPLTAAFTALAVSRLGARPVFADVEPDSLMLSVESAKERISDKTRALLPVHLYGGACDLQGLLGLARERGGIAVVEDACQAHGGRLDGKTLGSFGAAGTFSFYPTKNLGALGDGGLVVTKDPELAHRIKRLRNGGQSSRYVHEELGLNSRLDEMQAAVLRAKLPHLERENSTRREIAAIYDETLSGTDVTPVVVRPRCTSARHLYVVRAPRREALMEHLKSKGIQTLVHYPIPTHLQPAYRDLGQGEGSCPEAEKTAKEVLSLPLYPALAPSDARRVAETVREFYCR
jgi:dTDP-4-amino-4,6-dideoxygalactose transaminase